MSSSSQQQQQQQQQSSHPQLRRAVYVHVSDLTSAYNIDHARLDEELKRVKSNRENALDPKSRVGASIEMDSSPTTQKRLQPPRGGYNLCLLVGSVQIVVDKFRVDGSRVRVAEVEVGDETGTVSLRARDDQIDMLEEISNRKGAVVLRNATLELYQGRHIRLAVTKWGKLTPYPDRVASTPAPPSRMNDDRYFSFIDLSAVASEMAVFTQSDYQANRPSEFESTTSANNQRSRSTTGNRRVGMSRGKAPVLTSSLKQQPYQDNNRMLRYPGTALHSYGYAPEVDTTQTQGMYSYHASRDRQPDVIMAQQRYEMQQRHQQMHPQMHYQPASIDRTAPALAAHGAAPIVLPLSTPSFDAHFVSGTELGHQPHRDFNVATGPYGSAPLNAPSGGLPVVDSPRMNPQAPTFDPIHRQMRRK
ncbi:hypothetical protein ACA910_004141 [Epithemia clementina (nom. ined.)]